MSVYREFEGKSVEEALRNAREAFGVELNDLDFEILTPGSRGVLGMGAEPARIVAAPRSELGGAAPKREAAASQPLPAPPPREDRPRFGDRDRGGFGDRDRGGDRGPRRDDRAGRGFGDRDRGGERDRGGDRAGFGDRDRGPRRDDRGGGGYGDRPDRGSERGHDRDRGPRPVGAPGEREQAVEGVASAETARPGDGGRDAGRPPRRDDRDRGPRREDRSRRPAQSALSASEAAEVAAARGSLAAERADLEAAEASPEALAAGQEILEELMRHLGFEVRVNLETGETSRLNVVGDGDEKDALGALIGRKGERLSALQHLVNLMLSRRMGGWTRVLVDVEDYRGRRERQLRDLALRAAARVVETGKMLQLEPMPALERRWVHIALRENPQVATQSIGEEPNRRIVVLPREA
jgi:spoIIIJ-associated protein